MTYVSHTVRSLRRDPVPDETVRLVVALEDDADAASVREAVERADGEILRELQFGRLLLEVEQTEIGTICELDGVRNVETDAVLGYR